MALLVFLSLSLLSFFSLSAQGSGYQTSYFYSDDNCTNPTTFTTIPLKTKCIPLPCTKTGIATEGSFDYKCSDTFEFPAGFAGSTSWKTSDCEEKDGSLNLVQAAGVNKKYLNKCSNFTDPVYGTSSEATCSGGDFKESVQCMEGCKNCIFQADYPHGCNQYGRLWVGSAGC